MASKKTNIKKSQTKQDKMVMPNILTSGLFSDMVSVRKRNDGIYTIKFFFHVENNIMKEQQTIIVTHDHMKRIIDAMCEARNYYPSHCKKNKQALSKDKSE